MKVVDFANVGQLENKTCKGVLANFRPHFPVDVAFEQFDKMLLDGQDLSSFFGIAVLVVVDREEGHQRQEHDDLLVGVQTQQQ